MRRYTLAMTAICLSAIVGASPALAQQASSSAYALSVNQTVTVANVADVTVGVGPVAQTSGNAPPDYNNSASVASVTNNAALTVGPLGATEALQTGILTSNSTGTATGANATATVNGLSLGITASDVLQLINLSATTIQSYSQANSVGGLDASGMTTIEGLTLTGSALGSLVIDGSLFSNPAPNTVLLNVAGLEIILNEQTLSGDGITGTGITTNAIDMIFNGFPVGTGLVSGNVIVGNTQAFASLSQTASVPEPATWAMMLVGFGAMGWQLRRRRSRSLLQVA